MQSVVIRKILRWCRK